MAVRRKNGKGYAPDSAAVRRARKKLMKEVEQEKGQKTPEKIEKMKRAMQTWLHRHAGERIKLKGRDIQVVRDPVESKSGYVKNVFHKVKKEMKSAEALLGRVSKKLKI